MTDLGAFGLFSAVLLLAVGGGEGLRAVGWAPESSRRVVHAAVGLATALCPPLFSRPDLIYGLAGLFIVANLVAVPRRLLPGMHGIARQSWGTVIFPLALVVALGLCWSLDASRVFILQIAFGVLALADPAASWIGTRWPKPRPYTVAAQQKSLAGSAAFVGVAFCVTAGGLLWLRPAWGAEMVAAGALSVASLGVAAEALGRKGWDNLWIVLAAIVPLAHLDAVPEAATMHLMGIVLAVGFGGAAYRARSLDLSGALAASILAWMVVALGGAAWAVPAVTFFVLSSALSRWGRRRKQDAEALAEKGSRRDAGQVVANGGVGGALLAATVFAPAEVGPALYGAFVGAFAAAAADTWGTEIGTFFGRPTRVLGVGPRVAPGTSGGMSVPGTLGAALGAMVVVASAVATLAATGLTASLSGFALPVAGGGLPAAFVDSVLGATVQARFQTPDGRLTERSQGEGGALPLARGVRWVGNDAVNLACTAVGAVWAWLWLA